MHMSLVTNQSPSYNPGSANERPLCRLRTSSFRLSIHSAPARPGLWRRNCRRGTLNRLGFYQTSEFYPLTFISSETLFLKKAASSYASFWYPNDPVLQRETGKIRMYELRQMRHAQWVWRSGPAWASVTPVLSRAERGATRGQLSLASASNTQSPVTVSRQGNISSECFVLSPWPERQTRILSIWTKRKKEVTLYFVLPEPVK